MTGPPPARPDRRGATAGALGLAAALAVCACGGGETAPPRSGDDPAARAVSCSTPSGGVCTDRTIPAESVPAFEASCTGASTFAASPCSTADVLGSCTILGGFVRFYAGQAWTTAADAHAECSGMGGVWTGPSGDGGGEVTVSCTALADTCQELTGALDAATLAVIEADCGAVYARVPCPTGGAIQGSCVHDASITDYGLPLRWVYYSGAWTLDEAWASCTALPGATWVP